MKPHIRKVGRYVWCCESALGYAFHVSPRAAYNRWWAICFTPGL